MLLKTLVLLLLVCFSSSNAYEQQYQVGDIGENGGTIISVVVQEELSDIQTEVIGDFLETTEIYTYTETVIEEVEQTTYETVTTTTEIKTNNLLDQYTDTNVNVVGNSYGMTGAEITTGNQSQGGGTRVYDIDLDYDNIQQIDYGSKVYSHISNQNVPLCANTSRDCKDDFKISVRLYEDGVLKEQYTHNYTGISWVGSQDYDFTQDVSNIAFNSAELELYGIDRGYSTGYYGPGFSDMYFDITYNQINEIINEIINKIEVKYALKTEEYIYKSDYIAPPPEEIIEIEVGDAPEEIISFELNDFVEDIEFEIDIQPTEEIQEIEVVEVEEVKSEVMEEFENIEEAPEEVVEEVKEEKQEETEEQKEKVTPKEIKQKIANKIMASQKDKMSNDAQTTQLALMVILADVSFDSYLSMQIADGEFYKDVGLVDQNVIIDTQAGILGYMDYGKFNEMVDNQWQLN